jgi:hypothetical protein
MDAIFMAAPDTEKDYNGSVFSGLPISQGATHYAMPLRLTAAQAVRENRRVLGTAGNSSERIGMQCSMPSSPETDKQVLRITEAD